MIVESRVYPSDSISFAVESSRALERFKAQEFFVLSDIESGTFDFSGISKEISVFFTKGLFEWILLVEKLLHESDKKILTSSIKKAICGKLDENIYNFEQKLMAVSTHDTERQIQLIIHVLGDRYGYIDKLMDSLIDIDKKDAFSSIVSVLISSMENFLFELYEVDYLCQGGKKPFICVTDFMVDIYLRFGHCVAKDKAIRYREEFNTPDFTVKNYSSSPSIISHVNCLRENGIGVDNVV